MEDLEPTGVKSIGEPPWSRVEMKDSLQEFSELYESRPIDDNTGGMKAPHLFLAWFALRKLNPESVIESGVWLGQGTWFFEKACPKAKLYCIDPNLDRIQYRSPRAEYFRQDFSAIDWSNVRTETAVLFFDDHQDALERVRAAKSFGFKHILFEDNYPPSQGDCYSLKQAFAHTKCTPGRGSVESRTDGPIAGWLRQFQNMLGAANDSHTPMLVDAEDAAYLEHNLDVYSELPPVFQREYTRWGDCWDHEKYPTPNPLLQVVTAEYHRIFFDDAVFYTWMCYAKLR